MLWHFSIKVHCCLNRISRNQIIDSSGNFFMLIELLVLMIGKYKGSSCKIMITFDRLVCVRKTYKLLSPGVIHDRYPFLHRTSYREY